MYANNFNIQAYIHYQLKLIDNHQYFYVISKDELDNMVETCHFQN